MKRDCIEREHALRPKLTDEFLDTLAGACRVCGDSGDNVEIQNFVLWCYEVADKPRPEYKQLEAYPCGSCDGCSS